MSLNPESKPAANDTSQFIGRFLEERLIYERASRHDQLDYWLAKQELADHGHSIPDYDYLLKDLVKQHLKDLETENAAALQAKRFWDSPDCLRLPAWAKGKYGLEPSNDEATAFCFSKEDLYCLCLDRPIIGGRRQAQAADRKCLVIMLCTTRPDQCTCWSTFKCAVQRFAQLARCTHGPNMSNMTHKLPYTKSVVFCPEPQGQHQSFCSIVAISHESVSRQQQINAANAAAQRWGRPTLGPDDIKQMAEAQQMIDMAASNQKRDLRAAKRLKRS
ncbi:TPA: hypothetical protein ACH3X3_001093 [Trebouxia sp. C0006]